MTKSKPCPQCGKKAILIPTGEMYTTYTPSYPHEWWCACGYRQIDNDATNKDETRTARLWEAVNRAT